MRTMRWWWGLLCVAGMACGDEPVVGARPDTARASADLEFVLPAVRGTPTLVRRVEVDSARADRLEDRSEPMTAQVGDGGQLAFITQYYLAAHFDGATLNTDYGVHGWGTGWTAKPSMTVTGPDGRTLITDYGGGAGGDFLVPSYVGGDYREFYSVGGLCGASANISGYHEVRLAVIIGRFPVTKDWRSSSFGTQQPACTSSSPTGGGSTPSEGVRYTVCYYEVWIDLDGNVVDVIPLGCYAIGAHAQ